MNLKVLDNDCELLIALFGNLLSRCMKVHRRVGAPDEQLLKEGPSQHPRDLIRDCVPQHLAPGTPCSLLGDEILQTLSSVQEGNRLLRKSFQKMM